MATQANDTRLYFLLGSGFLRPPLSYGDSDTFISDWLDAHPAARLTRISHMFSTNRMSKRTDEFVYIWLEDGDHSLNVEMVKVGLFPGALMYDMVDSPRSQLGRRC
jgi:hypothetical protein